jgi:hypothetical protein
VAAAAAAATARTTATATATVISVRHSGALCVEHPSRNLLDLLRSVSNVICGGAAAAIRHRDCTIGKS